MVRLERFAAAACKPKRVDATRQYLLDELAVDGRIVHDQNFVFARKSLHREYSAVVFLRSVFQQGMGGTAIFLTADKYGGQTSGCAIRCRSGYSRTLREA